MEIEEHRAAFERELREYFKVSEILQSDLSYLFDSEDDSESWRRIFIRSAIPLIEGYCHYYRNFAKVFIATGNTLPKAQMRAIENERRESAADRIKLSIKAGHEIFGLYPYPNFEDNGWAQGKRAIEYRDQLMHPTTADDIQINQAQWQDLYAGIQWLTEKTFGVINGMNAKFGTDS